MTGYSMFDVSARMRSWMLAGAMSAAVLLYPGELRPAELALPDFASYVIARIDHGSATAVTLDQAVDALKDYDVVFVGEFHDHIANHLAELALLRALHQRIPKLALSMEQFERDRQSKLDDYLAGKIGEETLTNGLGWNNYAQAYRPLIEYAKDNHLPVIAANAPRDIVRCVAREGAAYLNRLPATQRSLVATDLHAEDGSYKQKFLRFAGDDPAHGGSKDGKAKQRMENNFTAQVSRDDTMAESIANFLQANPGYRVMHVTGAFHVAEKLGTVERLKLRMPQLKIALVMPVQTGADSTRLKPDDAGDADFAIFLRREPEPYATDKERAAAEAKQEERFRAAGNDRCS
jgi:uncharacterized iron-regulated protein